MSRDSLSELLKESRNVTVVKSERPPHVVWKNVNFNLSRVPSTKQEIFPSQICVRLSSLVAKSPRVTHARFPYGHWF